MSEEDPQRFPRSIRQLRGLPEPRVPPWETEWFYREPRGVLTLSAPGPVSMHLPTDGVLHYRVLKSRQEKDEEP